MIAPGAQPSPATAGAGPGPGWILEGPGHAPLVSPFLLSGKGKNPTG
jgi:hypothetical protein